VQSIFALFRQYMKIIKIKQILPMNKNPEPFNKIDWKKINLKKS
jgi:hypothetical protein